MTEVRGMGYLGIEADNLDAWQQFATDVLGLEPGARRDDDIRVFRVDDYAYRLAISPGPSNDVSYVGWEVASEVDLRTLAERVRDCGVAVTVEPERVARDRCVTKVISFDDPDGLRCEVFYGPLIVADAPFNSPRGISRFVTGEQGLGHIVLFPNDLESSIRFYCDVLGFSVSDYIDAPTPMGMLNLTFLHCSARHHSIAFGTKLARRRLAHLMLQVGSVDEVGATCDLAERLGHHIVATLGRHSNDHMLSFYVRTPSGWEIEFGCDGIEIDDKSWQVRRYDRTSVWGHRRAAAPVAAGH